MAGRIRVRLGACAFLMVWCSPFASVAKDHGVHSPTGRQIYDEDERFGEVMDQNLRQFVIEVAAGAGPEGNIGLLLGWINQPIKGIEFYAGIGQEVNPARHYTGTVRAMFNFSGYRPYVAAGYLLHDAYAIGTYSHNVFGEVGYKWVIHHTYHLTLGVGARRILGVYVKDSSILNQPDVDPVLLDEQLNDINPWVPMVALRFSRAF